MRCHYEVLQVECDVSSKDLRKAFYQLALKWHPDKHQSSDISPEEATQRFQEIQNAYEVLSDPHERKWYDDHRDQILRGDDGDVEDANAPYEMNLWKYFSPSVYSGFGDDSKSFYNVYAAIFAQLDALDMAASGNTGAKAPVFGNASSSSDHINEFYQHWKGYVTQQTFSWLDEYKTTDAPSRQIRRAMEKENKKLRDAAKKKFISEVRELVEFVKKRDPRMAAWQQQRDQLRKAMEAEDQARKQAKRAVFELQKQQFEAAQQEMWQQMEDQRRNGFRDDGGSDEQLTSAFSNLAIEQELARMRQKMDAEVLVCDLCRKNFKSMKQLKNHLVSKRHREKEAEIGVVCDLDDLLEEEIELEKQEQQQRHPQARASAQVKDEDDDEENDQQDSLTPQQEIAQEDEETRRKKQHEEQIRLEKAEKAAAKRLERKQKRKEQKQKQVEQIVQTAQQKSEQAAGEAAQASAKKKKNKRRG